MTDRDLVRRNPPDGTVPRPLGQTYLLAIAIDEYQHCTKLSNAVLDVETFIQVLTTRYSIEAANITFIKNLEATKRRIEQALLRLIKTVTPQDNLIIYFSGHGRHDEHFGGNWVPVEAGTSDEDWPDYLSNGLIKDYLSKIRSFHTFLIADSCFSGSLFIDKSKEKFTGDRRDDEPSRWGLTSGKKEIVSDGRPGYHSPFAAALLDVLRKAEQPLGVMRICDLVLEKVVANAGQTPMGSPLQIPGHQGGQMVLYFRHNEEEDWAEMKKSIAGCKTYLAKYPEGKHHKAAEAIILKEEQDRAWTELMAAKSIKSLYDFQQRYPTYPKVLSGEVRSLIQDLEEERLWQRTLQIDSISAYERYKERTELKRYVREAEAAIQHILADEPVPVPVPIPVLIPRDEPKPLNEPKPWITVNAKLISGVVAFGIVVLLLIWRPWATSNKDPISNENALYSKAVKAGTIPSLQSYMTNFPEGKHLVEAKQKLDSLEKKVDNLINDAEILLGVSPADALKHLVEVQKIDPDNQQAKDLLKKLK